MFFGMFLSRTSNQSHTTSHKIRGNIGNRTLLLPVDPKTSDPIRRRIGALLWESELVQHRHCTNCLRCVTRGPARRQRAPSSIPIAELMNGFTVPFTHTLRHCNG